jgi:hypothetical protein
MSQLQHYISIVNAGKNAWNNTSSFSHVCMMRCVVKRGEYFTSLYFRRTCIKPSSNSILLNNVFNNVSLQEHEKKKMRRVKQKTTTGMLHV